LKKEPKEEILSISLIVSEPSSPYKSKPICLKIALPLAISLD
jgi:hypothetical protein